MWDLPGPGIEPVSPTLAGGFLTTAPPGKSKTKALLKWKCKPVKKVENMYQNWDFIKNILNTNVTVIEDKNYT